jgi:hypothetical protein
MKMGFSGMGSVKGKQHSGITAMFNFRANHKLGPKRVAVHRIPCGCIGCRQQLALIWFPSIKASSQPWVACQYSEVLGDLNNNWTIVDLVQKKEYNEEEEEAAFELILDQKANTVMGKFVLNHVGAFATEDKEADGYRHAVCWALLQYILNEDCVLLRQDFKISKCT